MKLKISYLILFTLIVNIFSANATIRFVSKTGTSTPPYTSWETAADSIQKCINISQFGDTIYVANGVYKEQVVMIPGLSLIGAGMDSCIVDTRDKVTSQEFIAVSVNDKCFISGFQILTYSNSSWGYGMVTSVGTSVCSIYGNKFVFGKYGVQINNLDTSNHSNINIDKNIFYNNSQAVDLFNSNAVVRGNTIYTDPNSQAILVAGVTIGAYFFGFNPVIDSNYIETVGDGIVQSFGARPLISNNIIKMKNAPWGILTGVSDSFYIYNNLIISENGGNGIDNGGTNFLILYNNYITGSFYDHPNFWAINLYSNNKSKNNVVAGAIRGIYVAGSQNLVYQYNDVWNTIIKYSGFVPDTTNISVDPMVVNDDTTQGELDFHLQKFSPLIDAGDQNMVDKDSSRIDIGLYGGLYGEFYKYNDLAPRAPRNLSAVIDTNQILLKWNRNTESDTAYYRVYRDTVISFTIDSTKLVLSTRDTIFIQLPPYSGSKYVYKITCVDNQANESNPSGEIVVELTSVSMDDYPFTINDFLLYQNYPNPFNPSTKIEYKLKEGGYVKLYVYDIKGELVSVLVNKEQNAGFYVVEFSSSSIQHPESSIKELASGVYIYHLIVKSENNIPVYSDIKKMIFIK